jgi:hypothetical protein
LSYSFTATSDFTPDPIAVTFAPAETEATVEVPITNDVVVEDTESFNALLSTTNPNVQFVEDSASVTILDNDGKIIIN